MALHPDTSKTIAEKITVLASHTSITSVAGGMGFDGVGVYDATTNRNFYFDTTFGGDDGESERLRVYSDVDGVIDDTTPDDAPFPTDDPDAIARWILVIVLSRRG